MCWLKFHPTTTVKRAAKAIPPRRGAGLILAYSVMQMEHTIFAAMNSVGPAAKTIGFTSNAQNETVDAASSIFRTAAAAHQDPRARLMTQPPQNIVVPTITKTKPSRRPTTRTPKPEAPKISPSTKRKSAQTKASESTSSKPSPESAALIPPENRCL